MNFEEILNAEKQKYNHHVSADGTKHLAGLDGASPYKQFMKTLVSTNSEAEARAKSKPSNPMWNPIPEDTFIPHMPWGVGKSGTEIGPEATTDTDILPLPLEPEEYGSQKHQLNLVLAALYNNNPASSSSTSFPSFHSSRNHHRSSRSSTQSSSSFHDGSFPSSRHPHRTRRYSLRDASGMPSRSGTTTTSSGALDTHPDDEWSIVTDDGEENENDRLEKMPPPEPRRSHHEHRRRSQPEHRRSHPDHRRSQPEHRRRRQPEHRQSHGSRRSSGGSLQTPTPKPSRRSSTGSGHYPDDTPASKTERRRHRESATRRRSGKRRGHCPSSSSRVDLSADVAEYAPNHCIEVGSSSDEERQILKKTRPILYMLKKKDDKWDEGPHPSYPKNDPWAVTREDQFPNPGLLRGDGDPYCQPGFRRPIMHQVSLPRRCLLEALEAFILRYEDYPTLLAELEHQRDEIKAGWIPDTKKLLANFGVHHVIAYVRAFEASLPDLQLHARPSIINGEIVIPDRPMKRHKGENGLIPKKKDENDNDDGLICWSESEEEEAEKSGLSLDSKDPETGAYDDWMDFEEYAKILMPEILAEKAEKEQELAKGR